MDYEIAGRKWLPGSQGEGFPKYLKKAREGFPHALEVLSGNEHSLSEWAKIISRLIDENLSTYGTMLLRGLPLDEVEDIAEFSKVNFKFGVKESNLGGGLYGNFMWI